MTANSNHAATEAKLCECGCGRPTKPAACTDRKHGRVKGVPQRFIQGHQNRGLKLNRGPRQSAEQIFWSKVRQSDGCWEWTGALNGERGYGVGCFDGKTKGAHRYSYELHNGPIPDGLFVCHRCDNRKCVNPDHLFLGTHQDNMDDMVAKGRDVGMFKSGERNPGAKLTADDVQRLRELAATGVSRIELAADFGISLTQVGKILRGEKWTTRSTEGHNGIQ